MRINAARLSSQLAPATSGSLRPQTDAERQSLAPKMRSGLRLLGSAIAYPLSWSTSTKTANSR